MLLVPSSQRSPPQEDGQAEELQWHFLAGKVLSLCDLEGVSVGSEAYLYMYL